MAIIFPDGTQSYPTTTIQIKQHLFSDINSYSAASDTWQDITTATINARSSSSKILAYIEVHGYNGTSGMDRLFGAQIAVGNGSFTAFGENPNQFTGMNTAFVSNCRGDDHDKGYNQTMMFLIDNNWSDGEDLHVKVRTIGESTFYLNQGSQTNADRFGRGRTRIILREEIGVPS